MTLSEREKKIALGVGVTVAVVVLYQFILTPYLNALDAIGTQSTTALQKQADNAVLFDKQHRLKKVWTEMTQGGLKADSSEAESQAQHSILDWVDQSGVNLTALKPERTTDINQFQVISFHVTANGSTPSIARLLYLFETAMVPVRVDDMQVTPRKEGTDDLQIQLSVSTLCLKPDADSSVTSAYRGVGGKTWN